MEKTDENLNEVIQLRKKNDSAIILDNRGVPEEFQSAKVEIQEGKKSNLLASLLEELILLPQYFIRDPYRLCALVVSLWIACGIVFYKFYDNWTPATAFYYAVEAGLSIGFCDPSEIDDHSRLYTIFYVMTASSAVSGTLGLLLHNLFKQNLHLVPAEHGINAIKIRNAQDDITFRSVTRYIWYHLKYFIGWYHNRFLTIMTCLFILWMAVGTIYGVYQEGYTFITGLYFAITTCATGGLQSPPCLGPGDDDGTTCNVGDFRGSFLGVYMLIGVPIYAVTLSQYARLVFRPLAMERELKLMDRPIEDAQFLFAANVLSPEGSETLVLGEYILLELLRLGLVDQERIELLKKKFYELDVHYEGELELAHLRATGKIVPRKPHSVDIAGKVNKSLQYFYQNFPSPVRLSNSNISTSRSGSAIRLSRVNSAREFFNSFNLSKATASKESGVIELPPKRRPASKRAFRKSIHLPKSITETVEEIPKLVRSRANSTEGSKAEAFIATNSPIGMRNEVYSIAEEEEDRLGAGDAAGYAIRSNLELELGKKPLRSVPNESNSLRNLFESFEGDEKISRDERSVRDENIPSFKTGAYLPLNRAENAEMIEGDDKSLEYPSLDI